MKLDSLKSKLKKEIHNKRHPLRKIQKKYDLCKKDDDVVIIGVTGSRGKSTTAYLIHEYLKFIGKKSILYSSICVDSPVSYIDKNQACELPIKDKEMLLDIVEQAENYKAEYLVLEVSERAIEKGYVKDVPFDIKILTNLNPFHNKDFYDPEKYVEIKKTFFEYSDENSVNVFGLTDPIMKDLLSDFITSSKGKNILFGSRYISKVSGFDENKIDYLLTEKTDSLEGLKIGISFKNKNHQYKTKMLLSHNALNITCAIAVVATLKCYNEDLFKKFIENIVIPGREVLVKTNNRKIIVGMSLMPMLEELYKYKLLNDIKNIKVVVGAPGLGYKTWLKEFTDDQYIMEQTNSRKAAMDYLKKYADYVCITESDSGATPVEEITNELKGYIADYLAHDVVLDRKEAIEKVISESKEDDVIYISGRGNRYILCNGRDTVKFINDLDVVLDILKKLGWEINNG